MNFKEYQQASFKHLTTCKVMLEAMSVQNADGSEIINTDLKKKVMLHNLYYLSGYTLECIINYSILKHYKWPDGDSVYVTNHKFSNRSQLAFYEGTSRMPGGGTYTFWFSGHDFRRNLQILKKIFSASKVPLIDPSVSVDNDLIKLYNSWKVEIRYNHHNTTYSAVSLSLDNVTRFVRLTENIYNSLMKLVG